EVAGAEAAKVGAAAVLLAPGIPLLFMGEEWAAPQPFLYFTSHGDPELGRAVTAGRRREFERFAWHGEVPDPQDPATFASSRIDPGDASRSPHRGVLALYRRLLELRRTHPALRGRDRGARSRASADEASRTVVLERWSDDGRRLALLLA